MSGVMQNVLKGIREVRGESTLETTLGHMAPSQSGRVQECHLVQVAF